MPAAPHPLSSQSPAHQASPNKLPISRCCSLTRPRRKGMLRSAIAARSSRVGKPSPPKSEAALLRYLCGDKLAQLIDDRNRIPIALALRLPHVNSPCPPSTMPSQPGFSSTARCSIIAQLKAWPLPWQPRKMMMKLTVELFHLCLPLAAAASAMPQSGCK